MTPFLCSNTLLAFITLIIYLPKLLSPEMQYIGWHSLLFRKFWWSQESKMIYKRNCRRKCRHDLEASLPSTLYFEVAWGTGNLSSLSMSPLDYFFCIETLLVWVLTIKSKVKYRAITVGRLLLSIKCHKVNTVPRNCLQSGLVPHPKGFAVLAGQTQVTTKATTFYSCSYRGLPPPLDFTKCR